MNRVNTHRDGGDVVVPVVFAEPGEPEMEVVWETAGAVLEAVHPVVEALQVRHYDLQFAYADEAEASVIYRRVTVTPGVAAALREAVREGDDGVPPVYWQQFDAESVGAGAGGAGGC